MTVDSEDNENRAGKRRPTHVAQRFLQIQHYQRRSAIQPYGND